jgi:RNA recognition motif-containing protein
MHAEALGVLELARGEGVSITPALPELYIGNLPTEASREKLRKDIKALFREAGIEVTKVYIDRSCRFGFVTVASDADAERAIKELNNAILLGRRIVLDKKR